MTEGVAMITVDTSVIPCRTVESTGAGDVPAVVFNNILGGTGSSEIRRGTIGVPDSRSVVRTQRTGDTEFSEVFKTAVEATASGVGEGKAHLYGADTPTGCTAVDIATLQSLLNELTFPTTDLFFRAGTME